jgi:hypothetical protein
MRLGAITQINGLRDWQPPMKVTGTAVATTIIDNRTDGSPLADVFIQNVGTNAVKVCFNDTATATVYHMVVAGGVADEDGLGGQLPVRAFRGKLSVYGAAAYTLRVLIGKFIPLQ